MCVPRVNASCEFLSKPIRIVLQPQVNVEYDLITKFTGRYWYIWKIHPGTFIFESPVPKMATHTL